MRIEKMAFTPIPAEILEYRITRKNGIEIVADVESESEPMETLITSEQRKLDHSTC